jgi:hypothetical protein
MVSRKLRDKEVIQSCVFSFIHFFLLYMYGDHSRGRGGGGRDHSTGARQASHRRGGCRLVPVSSDHCILVL